MSYDLFFRTRPKAKVPDFGDLLAYFNNRDHYEVNDGEAVYENETTGVYFIFAFSEPDEGEGLDGDFLPVQFNMNYIRPHVFGLEAAPEVEAFVSHFQATVHDPQAEGMGDGEFCVETFLRGWNVGNAFGYKALLKQHQKTIPGDLFAVPGKLIEKVWHWNKIVDSWQRDLEERAFVPRMNFICHQNSAYTAFVWPDGIPLVVPEADFALVNLDELAPKRFLRKPEKGIRLARWEELLDVLSHFPKVETPAPHFDLAYERRPAFIDKWLSRLQEKNPEVSFISYDRILNEELIKEALGQSTSSTP